MKIRNISKKAVITLGIGVTAVTIFLIGAETGGANKSNWKSDSLMNASQRLNQSANNKKNEILSSMGNIVGTAVDMRLNPLLNEKEQEIYDELEAYFDHKLSELIDGEEFEELENELDKLTKWNIDQIKYDIDQAFKSASE